MSHHLPPGILFRLTAFLSIALPGVGVAQVAPSPAVTPPAEEIQEVVVTAERRGSSLQKVPIAVSVITGEAALKSGITTSEELSFAVPGLQTDLAGNGLSPFLRGVGTAFTAAGAEPSVAIYVDGVYIPSTEAAFFNLNNIERIEVLKGPQGTLFGRNATGGVIQIITKQPTADPAGDLSIGYGNYDTTVLNFYGTTGLQAGLAADLAVYADRNPKGWGRNLLTGDRNYQYDNIDLRNTWSWRPGRGTQVSFALDYENTKNQAGLGLKPVPGTFTTTGSPYQGFYNTDSNLQDRTIVKQGGAVLHVTQDLQFATFKSISSYRKVRPKFTTDTDASSLPVVDGLVYQPDDSITQELQLFSPETARLRWTAGLFYFHDLTGYAPLSISGLAANPFERIAIDVRQRTVSYAAYAESTFDIARDTHFTGGIRHTDDHRSIVGTTSADGAGVLASGRQSADFRKFTWRAALDHQFTPDDLGYVSYNRGFKSGLFNTTVYTQPAVKPEVLDAYEIGLKSEHFQHTFRANMSGYYYHYSDLQVTENVVDTEVVINAARAEIYGLDADFTLLPIRNLTLNASLAWIHGRYTSFANAPYFPPVNAASCSPGAGTVGACTTDATGRDTVHSPSLTLHMEADYVMDTQAGRYDIAADFYRNSGFYWDPANQVRQPRYSLFNASIAWLSPAKRLGIRLWTKNLGGAKYYSFGEASVEGELFSSAPPRTYGITISTRF